MFAASHDLKVLRDVVEGIAVYVVHDLVALKTTAKHGFRYEAVFGNDSASY